MEQEQMSEIVHSSFGDSPSKMHRLLRPKVAVIAIVFCLLLTISGSQLLGLHKQQIASADTLKPTTSQKAASQPIVITDTSLTPQPVQGPATHVTAPTPACRPFTTSTSPSRIQLAGVADGLAKIIDSPQQYQIYGNNPATIRAQIRQCAPKAHDGATKYAAETSYQITWQYSMVNTGDGQCRIAHAKVGVHVAQVMPLWQPSADVQPGLASQWQSFMSSLTTHENGHTDLDVQHAQTLLDDLNSFPTTPCTQLAQAVKYLTDYDIATLDQANDNYDSSTNHGATQGAILP